MPPKFPELRCFFCGKDPDRIAFYSKDYPKSGKSSIENPILSCGECYLCPEMKQKILRIRGGIEGISYIKFLEIKQAPKKKLGYYTSCKFFEINHLSNPYWRKILWRIFFYMIPRGGKEHIELPNIVQGVLR